MMALALFTLFAIGALASVLVLADSGLRAVQAWQRLSRELSILTGERSAALVQADAACSARIVRPAGHDFRRNGWRAAA